MKTFLPSYLYASLSLLAGAAVASSQHHQEPHHGHHHRAAAPGYDRATVTTMHCKVDAVVEEVVPGGCRGCDGGMHVEATCDGEGCDIHLGPAAFVKDKKFALAKGDEIEVTGSRVSYEEGTSLIAKEVRKGEAVLELRDEQGLPLWRQSR